MKGSGLRTNSIGVSHVVFFVVAAAAPLSAILSVAPVAFALGNGPGVPAVFLLIGLLYVVFSLGFTTMSPHVVSSSGFYAYVLQGLGRPAAVAIAAIALTSYQAIVVASYALFGFFFSQIAHQLFGVEMSWWVLASLLAAVVYACGRRAISFSGNLLAVCMSAEVAILVALGAAILLKHANAPLAFPSTQTVFGHGLGVSIVFIVMSFIGFEATVIFGEEARDPARTIPTATYVAVVLIAVFYSFCSWTITLYYGPGHIAAMSAAHPADLYFIAIEALLGRWVVLLANFLLLTSIFAGILSLHATISRYLAFVAREGLCTPRLAAIHPRHGSPHIAGLAQTICSLGMIAAFAAFRSDPYSVVFAYAGSFASIGIMLMQCVTCIAVIGYFRRQKTRPSAIYTVIAPLLAAAGLAASVGLIFANLDLVTGSKSPLVMLLPVGVILVGLGGWSKALWMKRHDPQGYSDLIDAGVVPPLAQTPEGSVQPLAAEEAAG